MSAWAGCSTWRFPRASYGPSTFALGQSRKTAFWLFPVIKIIFVVHNTQGTTSKKLPCSWVQMLPMVWSMKNLFNISDQKCQCWHSSNWNFNTIKPSTIELSSFVDQSHLKWEWHCLAGSLGTGLQMIVTWIRSLWQMGAKELKGDGFM